MFFTNLKLHAIILRSFSPILITFILFSYAYSALTLFLVLDVEERASGYLYREICNGQDLYLVSFSLYNSNKSLGYAANIVLDAVRQSLKEMGGGKYLSYTITGYRVVYRGLINGKLRVAVVVLNSTDPLAVGLEQGILYMPTSLLSNNFTDGSIKLTLIDSYNNVLYSTNTSYVLGLSDKLRYLYNYVSTSIFIPIAFYVTDRSGLPEEAVIEGIVYVHLAGHIDREALAFITSLGNYLSMYNKLSRHDVGVHLFNIASPLVDRAHAILNTYISQLYLLILYIGLIGILVLVSASISIKTLGSSRKLYGRLKLVYALGVDRARVLMCLALAIFLLIIPTGLATYYTTTYTALFPKTASIATKVLVFIEFFPILFIALYSIYSINIVYRSIRGAPALVRIKPIYIYVSVIAATAFTSFMLSPLISTGPLISYIPGTIIDSIKDLALILLIAEFFTSLGSFLFKRLRYLSYPIKALVVSTGILLSLVIYPIAVHETLRATLEKNTYEIFPPMIHNIYVTQPKEKVYGEVEYYMLSLGVVGINNEYIFLRRIGNTVTGLGFGEPLVAGIPIVVSNNSIVFKELLNIEPKTDTVYIYLPLASLGIFVPNLNKLIKYNNTEVRLVLGSRGDGYSIRTYSIKTRIVVYSSLPRGIYASSIILRKLAEINTPLTAPNLLPSLSALFTVAIAYSNVEDFLERMGVKRTVIMNNTIKIHCSEIQNFVRKFNVYNYTLLSRNNSLCQILYFVKYDMLSDYILYKILINVPPTRMGGKGIYVNIDGIRGIYVNDVLRYLGPSFIVYTVVGTITSIYLVFPIMRTYVARIKEYVLLYFALGVVRKKMIKDYLSSLLIYYLIFSSLILVAAMAAPSLTAIVLFSGFMLYFIPLALSLIAVVVLFSLVLLWKALAGVMEHGGGSWAG